MEVIIIAAMEWRGGIGRDNKMPWDFKDMQFFKEQTTGHAVIMGRKTYESIGRPLPNRANIVVSRSEIFVPHSLVAHSIEEAISFTVSTGAEKAFIIGGAEIYALAFPHATRIMITKIERDFECDIKMPDLDLSGWTEITHVRRWSDSLRCYYLYSEYEK